MSKLNNYLLRRVTKQKQVTLSHRKIYILPTKEGLYFALLLLLMLLTAINFSNNLIYFFTFFLSSIAIIGMIYTQINLLGISLRCGKAQADYCGEIIQLPILIERQNRSSQSNLTIRLQLGETIKVIDILADHRELIFPIKTKQRGLLVVPPIHISSAYPLRLFKAWSVIKLTSTTLIYPKPEAFHLDSSLLHAEGSSQTGLKPGDDEFYGLQPYIPGTSLKKVNWKMVAKGQGMYLKQFVEGSQQHKYWLDFDSFVATVGVEKRLSYLCYLIQLASAQDDVYGLKLSGESVPLGRGKQHNAQCLKLLALYNHAREKQA